MWGTASDLFPLDFGGVLLGLVGAYGLFYFGFREVDLVLLIISAVALVVLGLALLSTALASVVLWMHLDLRQGASPLALECGHPGQTGFSVPNLWWLPFANLDWVWLSPAVDVKLVRSWGRIDERVTPIRRGDSNEIVRKITVSDVFGLCSIRFPIHEKRRMRSTPSQGALKQMHVVQGMAGGDALSHPDGPASGDRFDMRHYTAGDPIRFVLWKVFAKSRTLVVRTPERAISPVRQTVAYLVATKGDEPAAGAARVAVDAGALGSDWVLGADGIGEPARQKSAALDAIVRSAACSDADAASGLAGFLRSATPGMVKRAVVFVPGTPGPWLDRVVAASRASRSQAPLDFVVCTDGIHKPPQRNVIARFFFGPPDEATGAHRPTSAQDISVVVKALASSRGRVMVVDRVAGRVYPQSHLKHLGAA